MFWPLQRLADWMTHMTVNPDDVARESFGFWEPRVKLPVHWQALLGDESGESSFRPWAVGDHGEAFGCFQWHQARIDAIHAATGIDIKTASHLDQLRGAAWEMGCPVDGLPANLHGSYRHVWAALMETTTLWSAITELVHGYEGSAQQGRDVKRRVQLAQWAGRMFG